MYRPKYEPCIPRLQAKTITARPTCSVTTVSTETETERKDKKLKSSSALNMIKTELEINVSEIFSVTIIRVDVGHRS
jgi:hypothetical protein